jgi:hypothetical protein
MSVDRRSFWSVDLQLRHDTLSPVILSLAIDPVGFWREGLVVGGIDFVLGELGRNPHAFKEDTEGEVGLAGRSGKCGAR